MSDGLTTILILVMLLADGGSIEVRADSMEVCEAMTRATEIAPVEITDEFGATHLVAAAYCETAEVLPAVDTMGEVM